MDRKYIEDKLIEAFMRWQSEVDRGDSDGKKYFTGGCDALIMFAQMIGCTQKFIQEELLVKGETE